MIFKLIILTAILWKIIFPIQVIAGELDFCGTPPLGYLTDEELSQRGVVSKELRWENGKTLKVAFDFQRQDFRKTDICRFSSSFNACHSQIKREISKIASTWSQYGNIHFQFDAPWEQAEIRIHFEKGGGGHSYVGNNALKIPKNKSTMLLRIGGYGFQRTVLHEFGHAIGFQHEHQSPKTRFHWNTQQIANDLNWSLAQTIANITTPLDQLEYINKTTLFTTRFDPQSIMVYWIPASWVSSVDKVNHSLCPSSKSNWCVEPTDKLSNLDKQTVAKMYPYGSSLPSNYPKCIDGKMKIEGKLDCCLDRNGNKQCFNR